MPLFLNRERASIIGRRIQRDARVARLFYKLESFYKTRKLFIINLGNFVYVGAGNAVITQTMKALQFPLITLNQVIVIAD